MSAIILSQRRPEHYIVQDSYLLKLVLSLFSGCFLCTFTFSHFQHCRSNQLCITMDNHQKTFECQKLFRNSSKTILTYCLTTILNWQFGPWPNKKGRFWPLEYWKQFGANFWSNDLRSLLILRYWPNFSHWTGYNSKDRSECKILFCARPRLFLL